MKPVHARMAGGLILLLSVAAAWVTSRSQPIATASAASGAVPAASAPAAQSSAPSAPSAVPNGGISPVSPSVGAAAASAAVLGSAGGAPDGVAPTPVQGIVEVRRGADIVYMTSDGKYVFTGDLF